MIYPKLLEKEISYFQKLPGIGEKSAERLALSMLDFSAEETNEFAEILKQAKNKLQKCIICGHISDAEICSICDDANRNKNLICVLEDYKSVFAFEKAGEYSGTYHILGGLISPIDDIGPEDINISSLTTRVEKLKNPELIVALKSTMEGETTTLYIKKIFDEKNIEISRLSYGIPMGAEIDYLDALTLGRALTDRKKIS